MTVGALGRIVVEGLKPGTNFIQEVIKIADENNIDFGVVNAIGTFSKAVVAYYNGKEYVKNTFEGDIELLSCIGSLAKDEEGKRVAHLHASMSNKNFECFGGHLVEAYVGYAAEVYILEVAGTELIKVKDKNTGLLVFKTKENLDWLKKNE
ncbi:hypothetical protein B9P99_06495 [Candidatus Marsarchaeota G1 archaeon OSP_B]|jgi:Predicted DNA-binding protein with PD1-like DNA-binding motif|nr:MAG: hypothetical protein B9Q02_01775 [Candidatus Marsarchaeota G1 archaeon BE_D]PSN87450.1 MAG: hypothetical protein B9P99_06495 [Candidatus Marsarchaeota G1 archaeon OSP_B]PSN89669.1 MAG: hypothetical protein B9Q00_00165 [Candidatus Marsarchaeota G1 archaeon OSP_C]